MKNINKIYQKMCDFFSIKKITWIALVGFIIMLLPVLGLSFINRATGDDYAYSIYTKAAWLSSYSILEVMKAIGRTIKQFYYGWQGTWFTIAIFTLQPEQFHEKGYILVAFFMLFIWCGSTYLLIKEVLKNKLKFDKWSVNLIIILFLILVISFIPRTQPAIYWYVGAVHYTIPFSMCQMVAYWLIKYLEEYKLKYFICITLFLTCLGGANYQAALFGLIITVYCIIVNFVVKKNKKVLLLAFPICLEAIGMIISMKAPGNWVRGGEEFGFTLEKGIGTIMQSFAGAIKDAIYYFQSYPLLYVGFFVIFLISINAIKERKEIINIKYAWLLVLAMYCLDSAVHAPAIYAAVDTSGGVYNTNFLAFAMMMMTIIIIMAERVAEWIQKKDFAVWNELYEKVCVPGLIVCMLLVILCRSDIKETTTWKCIDYIVTGQAADYKEQMEQFLELVTDENNQDVILPSINDYQGPLLHMPATPNKEAWTNITIRDYYGKRSVVAIPRVEWEKLQ